MNRDIAALLESYPRLRRPLPPKLQEVYEDTYLTSRDGKTVLYSITQALEGWMHRRVATGARADQQVLEIGAGTLNHLPWEPAGQIYDVVEPFTALYRGRKETRAVRTFYVDVADIPPHLRYQRILSVATLEHILDLPRLVAKAALHLAPGGTFLAGIPSEGALLWGASWRLSVGLSFRIRTGLNYRDLMRHEHVSQAREIIAVVQYVFGQCRLRRFPTPWHHLSLYAALQCSDPHRERCRELLEGSQPVAELVG